jgi:hypothetical protein
MNQRVKEDDSFTVDVSDPKTDFASAIKLSDGSVKGFKIGLNLDEKVDTKQQIEDFGVAKNQVESVNSVISQVFDGLKKAGLTTAKNVGEWIGIGKGAKSKDALFQATQIMSDKESLKKYGILQGKRYTVREIYEALEKRQLDKFGKIDKEDRSSESMRKIADWAAEEVQFMLDNFGENSGVGWYTKAFQMGIDKFAEIFPELKDDKNARDMFTLLTAIYSDGAKIYTNLSLAAKAYEDYRNSPNKKIPNTKSGGDRNVSYNNNIDRINKLLDKYNGDISKAIKYLLETKQIKKLGEEARAKGEKFSSDWPVEMNLPVGSSVLGPKLGMFFANLMGQEGYPTLDRWFSRLFNRYRGSVIPEVGGREGTFEKGKEVGLGRYKKIIGKEAVSDEIVLKEIKERANAFSKRTKDGNITSGGGGYWTQLEQKVGFKEGSKPEQKASFKKAVDKLGVLNTDKLMVNHLADKAANTINKIANINTQDAPFNKTDRKFMFDALSIARKKLKSKGIDVSIADIQAALWYFEKRLYVKLGGKTDSLGVSYEDVANRIVENHKKTNEFSNKQDEIEFNKLDELTENEEVDFSDENALKQGENAQYRIQNGKNIVEALKDFDGSPKAVVAITHEIMHPTVVAIIDGAKEGNEVGVKHTQTIVEEFNKANPKNKITFEELIEGNDAFRNGNTTNQYRAVQEFIAESWEKYHTEGGKGFSKAFQEVLAQITEAFKSVYKSISGKKITPELRKMFDEILGNEPIELPKLNESNVENAIELLDEIEDNKRKAERASSKRKADLEQKISEAETELGKIQEEAKIVKVINDNFDKIKKDLKEQGLLNVKC